MMFEAFRQSSLRDAAILNISERLVVGRMQRRFPDLDSRRQHVQSWTPTADA